jgi:hypothetical protein
MKLLHPILTALLLAACAFYSSEISSAPISVIPYEGWGCRKLIKESALVENSLKWVSAEQDRPANHDALMVFLTGVPTSGDNVKEQMADMKGRQTALHGALMEQNCLP